MADSMSEIYPRAGLTSNQKSSNNFEDDDDQSRRIIANIRVQRVNLAPKFKHKSNYPKEQIQHLRSLLIDELPKQDPEVSKFHEREFSRLLKDDWLATRFLLRGTKAAFRRQYSSGIGSIWDEPQQNRERDRNRNQTNELDLTELVYIETIKSIDACAKFKYSFNINANTTLDEFPLEWTSKNGIFNYEPDRSGNATLYMRVKLHKPKLIESKEMRLEFKRLLSFYLERCDLSLFNQEGKGICCIFDMTHATVENMDIELITWMIKSFNSCGPKLLCYVMVYNLPWFFSATFKLITNNLLSKSNKQSLKFVYGKEILNYIDHNNLPKYLQHSICSS